MSVLTEVANKLVGPWGSKQNPLVDPVTMASVAGVITPNYPITVVSGALAITGITVPYADFQGRITFLPTGAFTWTNATNIALAGTAVVGKALDFVYNPVTAKWYPSYIA
jgi:hypothetical protein